MDIKLTWLLNCVALYSSIPDSVGAAKHSGFGEAKVRSGGGRSVPYCGTSVVQNLKAFRIVGGKDADPFEYPWMAKLFYNRALKCAAALIADRYMVTAGHCVADYIEGAPLQPRKTRGNIPNFRVLGAKHFSVGMSTHTTMDGMSIKRKVTKVKLHPDYDVFASGNDQIGSFIIQTNDIAVLKINDVIFSAKIVPVCLPPQGVRVKNHANVVLAGWGSTVPDDLTGHNMPMLPRVLQKTSLRKISFEECQENTNVGVHLNPVNQITEREIFCLIGNDTDSCQGDSGGPVVEKTHHGYRLVGLVSWGIGCNQHTYPAAYTQVSSYMDFLVAETKDGRFLPYKH